MTNRNERARARTGHGGRGTGSSATRLLGGTIIAAGVLGAVAITPGAGDLAPVSTVASAVASAVVPLQPPVPPGPPVPPPMQEPGQQGPGSSIQDQPPGPAPSEPNGNAICQDIVGIPNSGTMIDPGCTDPSAWA